MTASYQPLEDPTQEWERQPSEEELQAMLQQAHLPGWWLAKRAPSDAEAAPGCWLGGLPTLPADIDWPVYAQDGSPAVPMHFLAQLDLAQVPEAAGMPDLPTTGTLFFFYDTIFAPAHDITQGGKVIWVDSDLSGVPERPMPAVPEIAPDDIALTFWYADEPTAGYRKWAVTFVPFEGWRADMFRNRAFQEAATDANLTVDDDLYQAEERRLANLDSDRPEDFAPHHMFATRGRREPDGDLVRLLALRSDMDLGFTHSGGDWIVFHIDKTNLASGNFDAMLLLEETQ